MSTMAEDPRESLMWEKELIVTSEELKTYAASFPPMGVYIPRGKVKVPHIRSRRLQHISQSAKGKPNSPNLLMIRPNSKTLNVLPPIDVYANRHGDVTTRHNPVASRHVNGTHSRKPKIFDSMTSQFLYPNDVTTRTLDYAKSFINSNGNIPPQTAHPVLPPPYVDLRLDHGHTNQHNVPDMTSLMPQEIPYPLGHQYYQHLSAIAAMAWSDCNQATEKLRRIYEETAQLSRGYDPLGILSGGIPGYNSHFLAASPAPGNTASMFGAKEAQADILAARYHQLAKDQHNYFNEAMTQNQYANLGAKIEKSHCDMKINSKQLNTMMSQSPLPGIALFNSQSSNQAYQNVPLVTANQRNFSRQNNNIFAPKTKLSRLKRTHDSTVLNSDDENYRAKMPRTDSFHPPYFPPAEPQMTSHMTSLLQESLMYNPNCQPPSYDTLLQNGSIPDLLKKTIKSENTSTMNFLDCINQPSNDEKVNTSFDDVKNTSSSLQKFCLPSVSHSPSQSYANLPFVLQ